MALLVPVAGITAKQLRDSFGAPRSGGRSHKGIDIFAPKGTPVVAPISGVVVKAGSTKVGGLRVWIRGTDNRYYYFAHLDSVGTKVGQQLEAGQQLGTVGNTGNAHSTAPHLHFSINPKAATESASSINPFAALTGAEMVPAGRTVTVEGKPVEFRLSLEEAAQKLAGATAAFYGIDDPEPLFSIWLRVGEELRRIKDLSTRLVKKGDLDPFGQQLSVIDQMLQGQEAFQMTNPAIPPTSDPRASQGLGGNRPFSENLRVTEA